MPAPLPQAFHPVPAEVLVDAVRRPRFGADLHARKAEGLPDVAVEFQCLGQGGADGTGLAPPITAEGAGPGVQGAQEADVLRGQGEVHAGLEEFDRVGIQGRKRTSAGSGGGE
ncbi:hypothetical protein [Streptomyces sp. NPDC093094]|uniref:hypothetical protein n=1 Tax=Streptomyces sp. NPDC093094 TaxID=3366026 RepID=UPI003802A5C1